jgi:hypothetical protein
MVYILGANVSFKYDSGARSHIIYIGTTGMMDLEVRDAISIPTTPEMNGILQADGFL